jgi:hypothetical protein
MSYEHYAARLVESGIITDPWLEGRPRFREAPLVLPRARAAALASAAEDLAFAYNELVLRFADAGEPVLRSFFGLTPWQQRMFAMGGHLWHGIARADLFLTDAGIVTTELNCDTPTGEAEACVTGALARLAAPHEKDPNAHLRAAFLAVLEGIAQGLLAAPYPKTVGLVYPTEFVEDLSVVRLYRSWLEGAGYTVVLGSPFNLRRGPADTVELFGQRVSILVRHYKTDWWGERQAAFDDEEVEDTQALEEELTAVAAAEIARNVAVVNPFGAVVPQNKRSMAFFWEEIHRFSPRTQSIIRKLVPPTFRLERRKAEELLRDREKWVLKSDYGAEGDEVIIGKHVSAELFRASLEHARKGRWVVQRYFDSLVDEGGLTTNFGVFLCGGRAAGIYARVHAGMTDEHALSVPVLVEGEGSR